MTSKQRKPKKAIHYSLSWDVFKAVKLVEMFEAKHGVGTPLPYRVLHAIYDGNLLPAIYFKKINPVQLYGVVYKAHFLNANGVEEIVEHNLKLSEPMKLTEFFNGYADCYIHRGQGLKTKGWKGAKDYWLDLIEAEYPNCTFHTVTATANCLSK